MSLNYLNISIFYLVNNWYLFYLNTSPPFEKTTRTRWIQESLHGKPPVTVFLEAMREHGVETTLLCLLTSLAFKHHQAALNELFSGEYVFSLTLTTAAHCAELLQWHRAHTTWDLIALYQWGPLRFSVATTFPSTHPHERPWSQEAFALGWIVVLLHYSDDDQIR